MKITEPMIMTSYELGKRLKHRKIDLKDGVKQLTDMGMNKNSAVDYIYYYSKLMANGKFTRTTNVFATKYFLGRILQEEGKDGLKIALNSLAEHLSYYEQKANVNVKGRRLVYAEYLAKLN